MSEPGRGRERDQETERYREAAIQAVEQLEWCAHYLHRLRKPKLAEAIARNRSTIVKRARLYG